jgi:hypothetical protein
MRARLDTVQELAPQLDAVVDVCNALDDLRSVVDGRFALIQDPLDRLVRLCARGAPTSEQAVGTWVNGNDGVELASALLAKAQYDGDADETACLRALLTLLSSVARAGGAALESLSRGELLEGLMRQLIESDDETLVHGSSKVVALCSDDAAGVERLVALHVMAVLLSRPSGALITAALPRLLRDERLVAEFCEQGGVAHLHSVVVFEQQTTPTLAACVAVIALLGKSARGANAMAREEGFVASVVSLLSNSLVTTRIRLHVVRALLSIALDHEGLPQVETALVLLLEALMERLDLEEGDEVALAAASIELLALLCNSREMLEQVDEDGGEEFPRYLLSFLGKERLSIPLCSLLHILSFGAHKDLVLDGMKQFLFETGNDTVAVTLELLGEKAAVDELVAAHAQQQQEEQLQMQQLEEKRQSKAVPPPLPPKPLRLVSVRKQSDVESKRSRAAKRRLNALKELHASERTYSVALFTVVKCFMPLLNPVLSSSEMKAVFSNSEEVYALHKGLIKRLDREMKQPESIPIGSIFLDFANSMHAVYSVYMRSNKEALEVLGNKTRSNKRIRQMIWDETKKIKGGSLSLENYLWLPMQRASSYSSWLTDLHGITEEESSDKPFVLAAAARITEVMGAIKLAMAAPPAVRQVSSSSKHLSESGKNKGATANGANSLSNSAVGFVPRALMNKVMGGDEAIRLTKHRTGSAAQPVSPRSASSTPSLLSPIASPTVEAKQAQRRIGGLSGAPGSAAASPAVSSMRKSPQVSRIAGQDEAMGSQIANRVSAAYGLQEKLRIASTKGAARPFSINLTSRPTVVVGHGYTQDGMFHFLDLMGEEVLVLPVGDLAKARKKTAPTQ